MKTTTYRGIKAVREGGIWFIDSLDVAVGPNFSDVVAWVDEYLAADWKAR